MDTQDQTSKPASVSDTSAPQSGAPAGSDVKGADGSGGHPIPSTGGEPSTPKTPENRAKKTGEDWIVDDDVDEEDEEDLAFHDVNLALLSLDTSQPNHDSQVLELDLSAHASRTSHRTADRRKPISKTEKDRRVEIHKTHLLCLLAHVSRRNRWCNDPVVQETLRPLLTEKMETYLNPDTSLPQFGRTQSLKNGLQDVLNMFKIQFRVTERGIRRALWAESEEHLQNVNSLHIACYGQLLIL